MDNKIVNIDLIYPEENIGGSLTKINTNFSKLQTAACTVEQQLDDITNVRTFFYYGPNAQTNPESGMGNNSETRPSVSTIQSFVNSSTGLDLANMSETGDIAYIIYQKTGWYTDTTYTPRSGSGTVSYTRMVQVPKQKKIGINYGKGKWVSYTDWEPRTYYAGYSWSVNVADTYNVYSPSFIIYRLTFDGTQYIPDSGFPKYVNASTASSTDWNNPRTWSTY